MGAAIAARRDGLCDGHFGIIFQIFNLLPYGGVIDTVLLPLSFAQAEAACNRQGHGRGRGCAAAAAPRARAASDKGASAANFSANSIGAPPLVPHRLALIAADEPTSALDRTHQAAFLDLLFTMAETGTERRREMAILRSVGARPCPVLGLLMAEARCSRWPPLPWASFSFTPPYCSCSPTSRPPTACTSIEPPSQ